MKYCDNLKKAILYLFDSNIKDIKSISGGCISTAYVIELKNNQKIFIKENSSHNYSIFKSEAIGLSKLSSIQSPLIIPKVLALILEDKSSYIMLEYLQSSNPTRNFWQNFGKALAILHKNSTRSNYFGLEEDNYIGRTKQLNTIYNNWSDFFINNRIEYQTQLADTYLDYKTKNLIKNFLSRHKSLLKNIKNSSLLHGDLWSGNYICLGDRASIIDPAIYYGDRHADIAMSELFGGYPSAFYQAYKEEYPLDDNYPQLKNLYNLYHMLNHLNIFGSSYLNSIRSICLR